MQEEFLKALRSYIGVPFHHQGRSRGGLDCVGLVIVACHDVGIAKGSHMVQGYGRAPMNADFNRWMGDYTNPVPYNRLHRFVDQLKVGDLLTFWIERKGITRHMAVYTGVNGQGHPTMIHSYAKVDRGVVETIIDPNYWVKRVTGVHRLPDLHSIGS